MEYNYEMTVPFYDVDPMLVVWHGNYVKYLEDARCFFLKHCNMTYPDMEKIGLAFPVVELSVKYIHPCQFGHQLVIRTVLDSCENFLIFKYEIKDKLSGKTLCKAQTKQMCVSLKTKESLFEIQQIVQEKLK